MQGRYTTYQRVIKVLEKIVEIIILIRKDVMKINMNAWRPKKRWMDGVWSDGR